MVQIFCDIDGCGKLHKAKGFCRYHYTNLLRHGGPLKTKTIRRSPGSRTIEGKRASRRADYKKHTERYKKNAKDLYEANKEKRIQQAKEWRKNNPEAAAMLDRLDSARRRAKKRMAEPSWLTEEHYAAIKAIYAEAVRLTKETGTPHHVDHIVPLRGKTASGLHVPWNLRAIPAFENLKKGAKIIEDLFI